MKYTSLVVYNFGDILESGQFDSSNIDEYLNELKLIFDCEFHHKNGQIEIELSHLKNFVFVGIDEYNIQNMKYIFNQCVLIALGKEAEDSVRIFTIEGNHTLSTSGWTGSESFFKMV